MAEIELERGRRPDSEAKRSISGLIVGAVVALAAITFVLVLTLELLSISEIPPSTVRDFLGISIQVNGSFLFAVFAVASFLLPRMPHERKTKFAQQLSADAAIFFMGLLESSFGFLWQVNTQLVVAGILVMWFLGFALLVDSIRLARFVEP